ncbi:YeeE/YedE thiosulfate transporter family protein [Aquincola agrisoli]|uniref:YeeE/YedE thiosulfate transporter family protein n=1 Tax=Aquincola TaxID=391952 RepID=UPI0036123AD9
MQPYRAPVVLLSGQFQPCLPRPAQAVRGLAGGVLLGWGAMTGLGCTVGNLLSGTMAGAVSGWVFGLSTLVAVWAGLKAGWAPRRR